MTYRKPKPAPPPPPKPWPDGPWDEDGNLRLPTWIEQAGPMPATWPIDWFWMQVGRETLREAGYMP